MAVLRWFGSAGPGLGFTEMFLSSPAAVHRGEGDERFNSTSVNGRLKEFGSLGAES